MNNYITSCKALPRARSWRLLNCFCFVARDSPVPLQMFLDVEILHKNGNLVASLPSTAFLSIRKNVIWKKERVQILAFWPESHFFEIMISPVPGLRLHKSCRLGRKCSFDIDKKLFHWDLMQSVPWNVKIKTQTCILECESKIQTTIWRKIFFQHLPVFFGVEFRMPLFALYCSVVIATVGVLFFLFFRASFSDLI